MSADGSITLQWADGDHKFRLAIGQLRELQEKCNAGPLEIMGRLQHGTWRVDDVREPVRLGLIGAGTDPMTALALVVNYIEKRPLVENVPIARTILMAALIGVPDDPVGKPKAGKGKTKAMVASPSPPSTASVLQ